MSERTSIRLVHWNAEEAHTRALQLRKFGYDVDASPVQGDSFKSLRKSPPAVVVIDLSRLPSNGRDVAVALHSSKATRLVPIVFVDGAPQKIERTRQSLPDATYTTWRGIRGALKKAIAAPPKLPAKPTSVMAGYSGTPLPKKLGIKEDFIVAVADGPSEFERVLGQLPRGARVVSGSRCTCDLFMWFVTRRHELEKRIKRYAGIAPDAGMWICWPKKASGMKADVSQADVRKAGLVNGLVDYKIAAIDATWSGLKFSKRVKR